MSNINAPVNIASASFIENPKAWFITIVTIAVLIAASTPAATDAFNSALHVEGAKFSNQADHFIENGMKHPEQLKNSGIFNY